MESTTPSRPMKYCYACGVLIPFGAEACPKCGATQPSIAPGVAAQSAPPPAGTVGGGYASNAFPPGYPGPLPAAYATPEAAALVPETDKRILPAAILAFLFGWLGVHRFYVGKIGTGFLQLATLGGLGIWAMIDLILIVTGSFTDGEGRKIREWV